MNVGDRLALYEDRFGQGDALSWDYDSQLAEILRELFEAIVEITGAEEADPHLLRIVKPIAEDVGESADDWREALDLVVPGCAERWEVGQDLSSLELYGRYGVVSPEMAPEHRPARIENWLKRLEEWIAKVEPSRVVSSGRIPEDVIGKVYNLALSRWNIDRGEGSVDPLSLSLLGNVSEGRVRNLMAGADKVLENVGGRASASSAIAWLANRRDFFESVWQSNAEDEPTDHSSTDFEQVVFVPIAKDSSLFHPGLEKSGGFRIGPKGQEETIQGYDAALERLQKMPKAYWRRPNASGNSGIVVEVGWVRFERAKLFEVR